MRRSQSRVAVAGQRWERARSRRLERMRAVVCKSNCTARCRTSCQSLFLTTAQFTPEFGPPTQQIRSPQILMIVRLASADPSSTRITSLARHVCENALSIACATQRSALKQRIRIETGIVRNPTAMVRLDRKSIRFSDFRRGAPGIESPQSIQ